MHDQSVTDRPRPGRQRSRRAALALAGTGLVAALARNGIAPRAAAQEGTPVASEASDQAALSAEEQLALEGIVASRLAQQRVPGAVAGVWIPGRGAWTHAAGIGDLPAAAPITVNDHFRIASVTKTFVATAILQLVDKGKLALDDALEPFVPGIANGDQITVRQLLGMTAGIFNFINDPAFEKAYTENPLLQFTPRQEVEIMRGYPADFPPGAKVQYADSNYVLLGLILEQVTGMSTADVITTRILEPLRLTHTSYPDTPEMPEPFPRGYGAAPNSDALRDVTESNPVVANAAGAMISTLDDLRVWGKALAEGTLLSPATQAERLQMGRISAAPGFTVGYGLGIMDINGFYGHTGAIFGYSTWVIHSPAEDATIVVLANRGETETEFAGPIAVGIAHLLFPRQFPRAAGTPVPATPEAMSGG